MRNGDMRRACLALLHHHVSAPAPSAEPAPVALGWHLERGRPSLNAMAALCGGALADAARAPRWRTSTALRALLGEYRAVRLERRAAEHAAPSHGTLRQAAEALH